MGSRKYSTPVDIWSVGCIFIEMLNGRALVRGSTDTDQLQKIFEVLGTPSQANWPSVTELPDWDPDFRKFEAQSWQKIVPDLCDSGIQLLSKTLEYDPNMRVTGKAGMAHEYFQGMTNHAEDNPVK